MTTFRIPRSARYDANYARPHPIRNGERCVVCAKPIMIPNPRWIHANVFWEVFPIGVELPQNRDQGMFSVGPECAKLFPRAYRTKI
jgi:hypothetical protein